MFGDAAGGADQQRRGPPCALCRVPATLYCRQDDAFLCDSCDARVHVPGSLLAHHDRVPTAAAAWVSAAAPSASDVSGSASLGTGATADQLRAGADSAPLAQRAALASCIVGQLSSHQSPFEHGRTRGLRPSPRMPSRQAQAAIYGGAASLAAPHGTAAQSLDDELLECLEGLCNDPLAPLDFGFDLTHINGGPAPGLEAFDSCMDCGTPLGSCSCDTVAPLPLKAGAAAAAAAYDLLPAPSTLSDCSTASRRCSGQLSPTSNHNVGAGPCCAPAPALWHPYQPAAYEPLQQSTHQVVVETLPPLPAMPAPRKRAAEEDAEGAAAAAEPRARASTHDSEGDAQDSLAPVLMSRLWAATAGVGSVVTTGMAGRGSKPLLPSLTVATSACLTPRTPAGDNALANTTGSVIWQQPAQASLQSSGSGGVAAAAPAVAGAVTSGVAEAAGALQRHAAAAVKPEPGLKLTIRMPATTAQRSAAAAGAARLPSGEPASSGGSKRSGTASGTKPAAGDKPPAGAAAGPTSARAPRAPRAPARRAPRAPAAPAPSAGKPAPAQAGGAELGGDDAAEAEGDLPPIPPYREGETRADKLARYRAKRERRRFKKTVRYECRKHYADMRPRIKGRFVSPEEFAAWQQEQRQAAVRGAAAPAPHFLMAC